VLGAMKENVAIDVLQQIKGVLDRHRIEYWLDSGTLLGAVREGKFLPWDHDIDLGAWENALPELVHACQDLKNKGFTVLLRRNGVSIEKEGCLVNVSCY